MPPSHSSNCSGTPRYHARGPDATLGKAELLTQKSIQCPGLELSKDRWEDTLLQEQSTKAGELVLGLQRSGRNGLSVGAEGSEFEPQTHILKIQEW